MTASACGSRATLATKLVPRSSIGFLPAQRIPHFGSRFQRRAHDRRVARAATQMPGQEMANGSFVCQRMFSQEAVERHQDAGRAEATLERVIALERGLQNPEASCRGCKAFNRSHVAVIDLDCEREAGARWI